MWCRRRDVKTEDSDQMTDDSPVAGNLLTGRNIIQAIIEIVGSDHRADLKILSGWVQRMMGHETSQMIYERYYSYIKNHQRDDGKAFMENVYDAL